MKGPDEKAGDAPQLRAMAEARLANAPLADTSAHPVDELQHELHVHQIELEMQNEALHQAMIALEESRDRYVDLYEFAPVGYLTLTAGDIIAAINLTGTRLLGRERLKLLHRSFGVFFVSGDDLARWTQLRAAVNRDQRYEQIELMLHRGDGTLFPAQIDCSPSADGLRITLTDITERKRVEEALRAATAEAEHANSAKSRFLAAASHDLRQPLAALRLYTNALQGKVAPGQQELLANMDDCVANLSALLNDLLDLSKLEAGVVKPNVSDFSVFDLLASLESVFLPKAQVKGLSLRLQPTGLAGRSDPVLYRRIVSNIIDNAIHYTPRGGLVIGCRRRQGKAWIEVWDSGIGIAADKITEIFEDFKQLGDGARNRGSGLGLAIVAKTAAVLGLEVSVRSWPGRGSVFAIELPRGRRTVRPVLAPPMAEYRRLRIALVEDNRLVREAMVVALQGVGHQVLAAANGSELLAELANLPPDIILSDYRLAQGESGFDVISAVRKILGAAVPAIIVTGDTDPKLMASMVERGVAVLHKPLAIETLQVSLEKMTAPAVEQFGEGGRSSSATADDPGG